MGGQASVSGQGSPSKVLSTARDHSDKLLNLKWSEITVNKDKNPAVKLYKKIGFKGEGEAEAYAFRNDEYVSAYHMDRIKKNA